LLHRSEQQRADRNRVLKIHPRTTQYQTLLEPDEFSRARRQSVKLLRQSVLGIKNAPEFEGSLFANVRTKEGREETFRKVLLSF
jgi:hypothetical protein